MAMRPLLISLFRMSSVYCPSPAGSPKFPGSFEASSLHRPSSTAPAIRKSAAKPYVPGAVVTAAKPAGTPSKPGSFT